MLTLPEDFSEAINHCRTADGEFDYARWGTEGMTKVTPLWLLKYLPNMPASHVAIYNDLRGPNNSITLREAAANLAVGEAFHTIARGSADIMVVGATGTRVHPMKSVHAARAKSWPPTASSRRRASRPFDRDRRGMVHWRRGRRDRPGRTGDRPAARGSDLCRSGRLRLVAGRRPQ